MDIVIIDSYYKILTPKKHNLKKFTLILSVLSLDISPI